MTILVESVLPYPLTGIAFLEALSHVYLLMCVSSQMLMIRVLRVAQGHAWGKESMKSPLSAFPSCSRPRVTWIEVSL
ncbi:hypothetical protein V8E55_008308 [Tylopilus felleus]